MSEDFLLQEWHDVGLKSDIPTVTNSGLGQESNANYATGSMLSSDNKEDNFNHLVQVQQKTTLVPTIRTLSRPKHRTKSGNLPLKSNGSLAINSNMTSSEAAKLLDISSDTSESDLNLEMPPKRKVRFKRKFRASSRGSNKSKATNSQDTSSCSSCYCSNSLALFGFLILGICSVTQIWFHYNLSSRVDGIQKQYNAIEAQSKETPEALHDYHIQLKNLEFNVTTFAEELKKINSEIGTINEAVRLLKSTTASLKDSIAAAPEIKTLPKDFTAITESVVNLGSKITQLESTVKELKTTQSGLKDSALTLQKGQDELKVNVTSLILSKDEISSRKETVVSPTDASFRDGIMSYVYKEIHHVQESFDELNATLLPKLNNISEWGKDIAEMNDSLNWAMSDLNSLHVFVYTNVTSMLRQVQSGESQLDTLPTVVEQSVVKILTEALNNKSSDPTEVVTNWKQLLRQAYKMVVLYIDIVKKLSLNQTVPDALKPIVEKNSFVDQALNDFERLNETVVELERSVSQQSTFQSSVNQSLTQLRNQINSFSIQLALLKSDQHQTISTSQSSETTATIPTTKKDTPPPPTTISSMKLNSNNNPASSKPVPKDLRNSNDSNEKTSILKRALGAI